jgi:hypothetical protein
VVGTVSDAELSVQEPEIVIKEISRMGIEQQGKTPCPYRTHDIAPGFQHDSEAVQPGSIITVQTVGIFIFLQGKIIEFSSLFACIKIHEYVRECFLFLGFEYTGVPVCIIKEIFCFSNVNIRVWIRAVAGHPIDQSLEFAVGSES